MQTNDHRRVFDAPWTAQVSWTAAFLLLSFADPAIIVGEPPNPVTAAESIRESVGSRTALDHNERRGSPGGGD